MASRLLGDLVKQWQRTMSQCKWGNRPFYLQASSRRRTEPRAAWIRPSPTPSLSNQNLTLGGVGVGKTSGTVSNAADQLNLAWSSLASCTQAAPAQCTRCCCQVHHDRRGSGITDLCFLERWCLLAVLRWWTWLAQPIVEGHGSRLGIVSLPILPKLLCIHPIHISWCDTFLVTPTFSYACWKNGPYAYIRTTTYYYYLRFGDVLHISFTHYAGSYVFFITITKIIIFSFY